MIYAGSYPFLYKKLINNVRKIRQTNPKNRLTFIISSNNMRRAIKEYLTDSFGFIYNIEFFTKIDIAREMTGKQPINNLEKEIIINKILEDNGLNIEGLAKIYSEAIQKLKESKIYPEDLPENEPIRIIYTDYQKKLEELNLKDREDILKEASIKEFKTDFLFIFGFHSLSEIDRDIFVSLLKNRSLVYIPMNPKYAVFEKNPHLKATLNFFKSFRLKTYIENIKTKNQELISSIFSEKIIEKGIDYKCLRFIISKGKKDEIKNIAKTILSIKEETKWHKIGVVINDLGSYLKDIKSVFNEYNIPYYLSEENRFIDELPFKKIFSLFSLKEKDFPKMDILNSLSMEILNIEDMYISELEKELIETPHENGYENALNTIKNTKFNFIKDLLTDLNSIPENAPINIFVDKYRSISEKFFRKNRYTEKFLEILNSIKTDYVLKKLYPEIKYTEFNRIVLHYLEEEDVQKRLKGDIVQIRTPNISEGIIFDYLFFIDMNEGKYPSTLKEDPILKDSLRNELEKKGLPDSDASYWQQIVTFINIFNSSKNIFISFKEKDEKGNDLSPSVIVEELLRFNYGKYYFENKPIDIVINNEILTIKEFKIKNAVNLIETDNFLKKVVEAYGKRESEHITEYDGKVKINLKNINLTPSKLQTYSDCPYRFFLSFIINPDTFETVDDEKIPPDKEGTIIHEILEFIYKKRIEDEAVIKKFIPLLFKEKFSPLLRNLKPSARIFEERRLSVLSETLTEFVINDLNRIKNKYIPQIIELKGTVDIDGLKFKGKIDRADINIENNTYSIYDYKTGKKRLNSLKKALLKGDYIQLILYRKFLERLGKKIDKLGLFFIKESFPEISINIDKKINQKTDKIIKILINMIKKGYFIPYKESESCYYCEFAELCRIYSFNENKYRYLADYINLKKGKLEVD